MSTYVIGDIHGQYNALRMLLDKIEYTPKKDTLYFTGDYIDAGPHSMDVLKYLSKLKKNGNVYCLLGNHDDMMLQYLRKRTNEIKYDNYGYSWFNNKGQNTLEQYQNLPENEQEEIFNFLKSLDYFYDNIEVNNKKYYIVHSHPIKANSSGVYDFDDKIVFLWERWKKATYNPFGLMGKKFNEHILICGHTMTHKYTNEIVVDWNKLSSFSKETKQELLTMPKLKIFKGDRFINVDCGGKILHCTPQARLAAYRLEDGKEFYVNPYKLTTSTKKINNLEYFYIPKKNNYIENKSPLK